MIGLLILDLNAPEKNILSIILPMPTTILSTEISNPVIIGENHTPNVVPTVKYALDIRLNTDMFIFVVIYFPINIKT